jgi:hypothetical protein
MQTLIIAAISHMCARPAPLHPTSVKMTRMAARCYVAQISFVVSRASLCLSGIECLCLATNAQ